MVTYPGDRAIDSSKLECCPRFAFCSANRACTACANTALARSLCRLWCVCFLFFEEVLQNQRPRAALDPQARWPQPSDPFRPELFWPLGMVTFVAITCKMVVSLSFVLDAGSSFFPPQLPTRSTTGFKQVISRPLARKKGPTTCRRCRHASFLVHTHLTGFGVFPTSRTFSIRVSDVVVPGVTYLSFHVFLWSSLQNFCWCRFSTRWCSGSCPGNSSRLRDAEIIVLRLRPAPRTFLSWLIRSSLSF